MSGFKDFCNKLVGKPKEERELVPVTLPRQPRKSLASLSDTVPTHEPPDQIINDSTPQPKQESATPSVPSGLPPLPVHRKPAAPSASLSSTEPMRVPASAPTHKSRDKMNELDDEKLAKIRQRAEKCRDYDPKLKERPETGSWILVDRKTDTAYAEFQNRDDAVFHARAREYVTALYNEIERLRESVTADIQRLEEYISNHRSTK